MVKVLSYSGGKDSTATALYLLEQGIEFQPVFCDTKWEHPKTYDYIKMINERLFNNSLITLESEGMQSLVTRKKRVPSIKARFCTEHLKVKIMIAWLKTVDCEVLYQGIRMAESRSRMLMLAAEYSNDYGCDIERPIFRWNVEQVFAIHKKYNIEPNPVYLLGSSRVGCFPCVLINHSDLKALAITDPTIWDRCQQLEDLAGRSFFPPYYIPQRFHSGKDPKTNTTFPTVNDVKEYLKNHDGYLFEPSSCMSVYNLCE